MCRTPEPNVLAASFSVAYCQDLAGSKTFWKDVIKAAQLLPRTITLTGYCDCHWFRDLIQDWSSNVHQTTPRSSFMGRGKIGKNSGHVSLPIFIVYYHPGIPNSELCFVLLPVTFSLPWYVSFLALKPYFTGKCLFDILFCLITLSYYLGYLCYKGGSIITLNGGKEPMNILMTCGIVDSTVSRFLEKCQGLSNKWVHRVPTGGPLEEVYG
ncbi:uncharacterized protein LOC123640573 [Lemur catta]|uniref:uncharacterized protein LOC123640573 n=1 Tax=Lemur catta TaxID=9447 RepID=UPI001E26E56B|nr:uncharacterized protein LOC123640573 [Lemur catta]